MNAVIDEAVTVARVEVGVGGTGAERGRGSCPRPWETPLGHNTTYVCGHEGQFRVISCWFDDGSIR